MKKNKVTESALDFPRESLDTSVWKANDAGEHDLTDDASNKIQNVVSFIEQKVGIHDFNVNITGSITSNCYTEDSDIDIHFNSPSISKDDAVQMNAEVRDIFDDFKASHDQDDWSIGSHPLEVYYQGNPFQDLMSVGCYSFTQKHWLVGPDLQKQDFNPFEEYYNKDMKYVNKLIGDIRSLVLEVYEKALVANKFKGREKDKVFSDLSKLLNRSFKLFTDAKNSRKHLSEPHSEEEAKKFRNDKKWKIADSAFKLLDKFGYLAILREYATQHEQNVVNTEKIVEIVRQNLGFDNKKLHELEDNANESTQDKVKMWVDDIRQVPEGYVWFKSTNDAIAFIEDKGSDSIEVIDIDHDAGDYQSQGGDYIRILDFLEFIGAKDLKVRIHSANAVGIENMRRIIRKNSSNGWKEVFDIMKESANESDTPQYDRAVNEIAKMISQSPSSKLGMKDQLNRGNKCILLWHGDVKKDEYGISDYSDCDKAWDPNKSWGIAEVQTFPHHEDLSEEQANEVIRKAKAFISKHSVEQVDEGAKEAISASLLAMLLAVPGILPAKTVQKSISNNQKYEMIVKDLNQNIRMVGNYTAFQAANIIARTLYAEARNDGKVGMEAVASVIYNRAEGDKALFTNACLKPMQFSCWNKFTKEEADPKNFKIKIPSSVKWNKKNEALWKEAMSIAADMLADAFKPTTSANSYFNPQKCSPKWDKELKDVAVIGSHKFGTLKNHSPFV